ncbi:anti-sigma regulatory factor [Cytophaga hutchinsonii]|jgi:serine/threonine-protein kinase RsbT|uniref:Anti-sigma regulatory factor Ser/Thr protein kinase n=1 Tax=Cytophaga hutchinsonii (strain ATCC 33406 / DSM 1761 / CIP 103989 / NBRC 15051 / NCIMB 9469 / D465) TaxID=269798 RepID=A0A6N4SQ98_CYTH3|nr:anti-sigma regulatory factor; Ser/Thr protein kinase [Cytophaga hutchinsonii ATCC 33406]
MTTMTPIVLNKDSINVFRETDVVPFRSRVKEHAVKIGMSLLNQTKLITGASELVRNMLKYGNGGIVRIEIVSKGRDTGIRLIFEDKGPGIPDINKAMTDGFTTGKSMGLGLPGTKRLMNEFNITSEVGVGTTVTVIKWKNG